MKKITKNTILIAASLILLMEGACTEWLDVRPLQDLIQDEYWQTKEDVSAVLMGAYSKFASLDGKLFEAGELRADMIVSNGSKAGSSQRSILDGDMLPTNTFFKWNEFYEVISYSNYVLDFSQIAFERDPTFKEYTLQGYRGEALFLRSLAYFYLVRLYKEVPLVLYSSQTDGENFFLVKSSEEEILTQIIADLQLGIKSVTDEYTNDLDYYVENNKGRAKKEAFRALLADIYLWQEDYANCITQCDLVLQDERIILLPSVKWFENYYPGNSLESIFEFQFDQNLDQSNNRIWFLASPDGTPNWYKPSNVALEMLWESSSNEAIRGPGSIKQVQNKETIWKYYGAFPDNRTSRTGSELYNANMPVYRRADVMLMKAEALGELQRFEEAMKIINEIRKRAFMTNIDNPGNLNNFELLLLEERGKEFAFEGKRWYDLLRFGKRRNYERKEEFIRMILENVPSTRKPVLAARLVDPWGWYLPIPDSELERNKNLEQNPYYSFQSN
jgi:hypothetical protein